MSKLHYTTDALEAGKSVGFLVKRFGLLIGKVAKRRFVTEGISFTQWFVLASLSGYERVSATTLSAETGYDMGALTRIIDGLQTGGLVQRERSNRDRRAVQIGLTSEGRRRLQAGKRVLAELLTELAPPHSPRELGALIGFLRRMLVRLQESIARG